MKPSKKLQAKLTLRQGGHSATRKVAKEKQGVNLKESAWEKPGSGSLGKS